MRLVRTSRPARPRPTQDSLELCVGYASDDYFQRALEGDYDSDEDDSEAIWGGSSYVEVRARPSESLCDLHEL